ARRRAEQRTRRHAANVGSELVQGGSTWRCVADHFSITERTLRRWRQDDEEESLIIRLIGRPVPRSSRQDRNLVIHFLDKHGPHVGVSTLRSCFPAMSRSELTDLVKRYRRVLRKRNRVPLRVLDWRCPGRAWAIDFSDPLPAIDGRYPYLLAVRDVCTGEQILWLPVENATGEVARDALAALFVTHGAPLVLKSDNGSPFTGSVVQELLAKHEVVSLLSPPYWPRYNGAIEAGIGSLKDRTEAAACRAGHAGYWTWDDVAQARLEANTLARPRGASGPSPEEAWASRMPITSEERAACRRTLAEMRSELENASAACVSAGERVTSEGEMARCAIRLTLERRGYLHDTRRSIPPPI
ncbi:MAG: DDE-type integrase/transposase/recombinase, partial [Planctomycetes bacterium]|nr:DDE-type integrase/transposase/recombinase [Planctomycetota bacterium]